jgi:hypothetical protein
MARQGSKKSKADKAKRAQARRERSQNQDPVEIARKERATAARQDRLAKRNRAAARSKAAMIVGSIVLVGLLGFGLFTLVKPAAELAGVERPTDLGRGHVENATYPDSQPTSGPHSASAPGCTTYTEPLDPALAVHALEHGAVVLWFDPAQPELSAELEAETARFDTHVAISPGVDMSSPIVATAWNRRASFTSVSSDIGDFVETYRFRGPESEDCS